MLPIDIKEKADKKDEEIISVLKSGRSFCVEAGAGAGKTYSLNKVIDWLRDNKAEQYMRNGMQVICITFTNAAVDVIASRLNDTSFIVPSTIHSFAWGAIKQFQYELIKLIKTNFDSFKISEEDSNVIEEIRYTLGNRSLNNNVLFLYHDDVIKLFVKILDNESYRIWFSKVYPLILIDEYQDTRDDVIQQFIKYFIEKDEKPQIGFFGDSWQTIYQMNNACGEINCNKIVRVSKHINFRSSKEIVDVLNNIRPSLIQLPANNNLKGNVKVILCDDFNDMRRSDKNFKGDLPVEEFNRRISAVENVIQNKYQKSGETLKTLMLTNRILADYQGYDEVLTALGTTKFREESESIYQFFKLKVEPMRKALSCDDMCTLMDVLGQNFPPIRTREDKVKWLLLKDELSKAESMTAYDVIGSVLKLDNIIPIQNDVIRTFKLCEMYKEELASEEIERYKNYLSIKYQQFINAINYFEPESMFSTEHGSKGEEYDNVLFVISKGWSLYNFDKNLPIEDDNNKEYIRNRNLFYVSCSRAKRNLFLLITYPISTEFMRYVKNVFGEQNVIGFNDFVKNVD